MQNPLNSFSPVRRFVLELGLALCAIISIIFLGIYLRTDTLQNEAIYQDADSYEDLISQMRDWNAGYGGVYVKKRPGIEANQYLKALGVQPDIVSRDGDVLTMRNHAIMTSEISVIASGESGVSFRIFGRKPLNPKNSPDGFESSALARLERGEPEVSGIDRTGTAPVFRLVRPLKADGSCMPCHMKFGFKPGDVIGAIGVNIPYGAMAEELKFNKTMVVLLCILTMALVLLTLYILAMTMAGKLKEAQSRITELSITDELTGLRNRRFIMDKLSEEFERSKRSGRPLGVVMLDLDHFKDVNDTYGHPFGDVVLKTAAARIKAHLRPYDLAGRFGGEEFLVVCPDVTTDGVSGIAERIRQGMSSEKVGDNSHSMTVTASLGVTVSVNADKDIESVLKRADDALYEAKHNGRDRVERF